MKTILVVDDSRTVRMEVKAALLPQGYEVLEAADGAEGLVKMNECENIAMIICDVNMPKMNGLEMLTEVQKNRRFSNTKVMMMTTEGSATVIKKAQALGATAWLVKPFKGDQLVSTVARMTQ